MPPPHRRDTSAPVKTRHTFRRPRVARPGLTHPVTSCPLSKESPRTSLSPPGHLQGFQSAQRQLQITKEDQDRIAAPFWRTPYAINLFLDSNERNPQESGDKCKVG